MLGLLQTVLVLVPGALGELVSTFISDWLGPIFLAAVAIFSIKFIKERQFMQLLIFVIIAAIVGLLVYNAESLFGAAGTITEGANELVSQL